MICDIRFMRRCTHARSGTPLDNDGRWAPADTFILNYKKFKGMAAPSPAVFGRPLSEEPPLVRELDVLCPRVPKEVVPFSGDLRKAHEDALLASKAGLTAALLTFVGENKLRFETCVFEVPSPVEDDAILLSVRVKLRPATVEELEAEDKDTAEAVDAFVKSRLDELWEEAEKKDGDEKRDQAVAAYKATCDVEVATIERLAALKTEAGRREAYTRAKNLEAAIKQRCDSIPWFKAKFEALLPPKSAEELVRVEDSALETPEDIFGMAPMPAGGAASGAAAEFPLQQLWHGAVAAGGAASGSA